MRTFTHVLLLAILLIVSAGSLFAGGFALSGIGSKAIGMGGAFRGMADDGTAMYWNPAGLGFLDNSLITLAGAGIMPTSEFENTVGLPGFALDEFTAEEKLWLFPNLYAVKACSDCRLKFGLGAYVPYGLGAEWDIFNLPEGYFPVVIDTLGNTELRAITWNGADEFPEKEMKSSIGILDIHPTVAYKFSDKVSMGVGLSVNYAMIEIAKLIPHSSLSYYLPTTMSLEGTGLGFGANLGLMYKPNDVIQIGLSGKIPSNISMDGDVDASLWVSNLAMYKMNYDNNPLHYETALPFASVNATYSDETDAKADLTLPADLGWGMSVHLKPNWILNADCSYTFWNAMDKIVIEMDPILDLTIAQKEEVTLETNWKDAFRFSLGTQYSFSKVDLRGGFFYDESPIPYSSLSPTWPDTGNKYSGNAGLGLHLGRWLVDLNYEHIFFGEKEIENQTADNMVGIYNSDIHAFNMGLTYNF